MDELLDLKNSKLILEGTKKEQDDWSKKITDYNESLKRDCSERKSVYRKRRDFFSGNQYSYSNITGIIKDIKQKKGHTNQVANYAGKTVVKTAFGLANNPPKLNVPPLDPLEGTETARAQAVEDFQDAVFNSRENRFWKKVYRRSCFDQGIVGDAAIKTFVLNEKIRIVGHNDMVTIKVGWNGLDSEEFDFVISETLLTADAVEEQFGIKVNRKKLPEVKLDSATTTTGDWDSNQWATKGQSTENKMPSGKTDLAKLKVLEFDSLDVYALKIEGELVELVFKDDKSFPRVKFWTIVKNIPNPPFPWSIADIDYLIDPQIELNDNDSRSADYIRVGGVQRYVAYNLSDFDPESLKTSSGQVIFVNDPDGKSRFEPLQTNINNFPADQYATRKMQQIYDLGLPKVNYGASGADSGRSKAIDYQSSIDLTVFKRDAWELALQDICEKIQILGHFLHPKVEWFNDKDENFVVRNVEFDWTDILPISQSDKIVNIANKYNMLGIPLIQAYKELGYRNPEALLQQLKKELADPDLMTLRAKMWQLSKGILEAGVQASTLAQGQNAPAEGQPNQSFPVLTPEQGTGTTRTMAQKGGTTAYSSATGLLQRMRQNLEARGG